jgi:hypothetical protein
MAIRTLGGDLTPVLPSTTRCVEACMTITLATRPRKLAPGHDHWPRERALQATWDNVQERRFAALGAALARNGGFVPADQLCCHLRMHWDQPLSRMARWIVRREVVSVSWRAQIWLPMFQFERPSLDIRPAASEVIAALRQVYDDWELAEWFVRPHDLLARRVPAAELACDPGAVKEAARLDRFVNRW